MTTLAGCFDADAPQRSAGGDEQGFQVAAAERAIRRFVAGYGNELQLLAFRRKNIDPGARWIGRFIRQVRLVDSRGDEQPTFGVELDAVGPAGRLPIVDQLLAGGVDRAVGLQIET